MKRARPGLPLLAAILAVLVSQTLTFPARADCTTDIRALRGELNSVKDPKRKQELEKLIDKAEKDNEAGRAVLCDQAMQRARVLIKG